MSSFVTSFVIISLCWGGHDKIFSRVRRLTPLVTLLNFGFMICVVWMPVATSLLDFRDRTPYICYAVTLFTTRLLLAIMFSIIRRDPRMWAKSSRPSARFFSHAAEVRSYVAVALFGLAGLLAVFGPVHGTSRQAFYALIVLKLPICVALKRLFPALMADEGRGYVV